MAQGKKNNKPASVTQRSLFNLYAGFILFFALILLIWMLRGLLAPVFLALLLSYIFSPLITFMHKKWRWPNIIDYNFNFSIYSFLCRSNHLDYTFSFSAIFKPV